jgi:N-acetylglucosamine kinase-like BadF-type ATPase
MTGLFLGIDGGGTKTTSVLMNAEGRVLSEGRGGPANALRCGFETAFASLDEACKGALESAKAAPESLSGICAGLAGAGRPRVVKRFMAHLVERFPGADVQVTTDSEVALEATASEGPAVVLIAGTGSVCCGRGADGRTARAGGYGPHIGDEGSAYDIGRRAVMAVARARDALGPVTILSDLLPPALGLDTWEKLAEKIAESPDSVFPVVFPAVLEAAAQEDAVARDILFRAALALSRIAASVVRRLDLQEVEFPLAKSGGVFGHSEFFEQALDSMLGGLAPRAHITPLPISPAEGAARMARRLLLSHPATFAHGGRTE